MRKQIASNANLNSEAKVSTTLLETPEILQHKFFPVNLAMFLREPIYSHLRVTDSNY